MTSRTVTPLYDQALEAVLDDDAMCESRDCTAPAVARLVIVPCGCSELLCQNHQTAHECGLAMVRAFGSVLACKTHPARVLTADDFRIYPI